MTEKQIDNENTDQASDINIKVLGHHGICSGNVDKLKLVERFDKRLPVSKEKGAILTHGQRVKAMIINGLGFTQNPIYLTPHFFKNVAVEQLFGKGIVAEHFNDDALGRTLDAIYDYGPTALFAEIANEIIVERRAAQGLTNTRQTKHLDTSSLKLTGEYEVDENDSDNDKSPPIPKLGHSKDHRPDLKQLVLSLSVTGKENIPVWFECLDGNSQDKANFHNTLDNIKEFRSSLQSAPELLIVADSALYTKDKLQDAYYDWITRIPENIKAAKSLVIKADKDFTWKAIDNGYKYVFLKQNDRGMDQHWALFHSDQAEKREIVSLERRIKKALENSEKESRKMSKEKFACKEDAERAGERFKKKLKYHTSIIEINAETKYLKRGRPSKVKASNENSEIFYKLNMSIIEDAVKQAPFRNKLGRFILGTNQLDEKKVDASLLLSTYKEQQGVERGFRFIKDPQFHLNSIFLNKPERINSLMMIMTLCLMVYNVGQSDLRENLNERDETLKNQVGKSIKTPTLRWLFQQMTGVYVVTDAKDNKYIIGLTEEKRKIIEICGEEIAKIYKIS